MRGDLDKAKSALAESIRLRPTVKSLGPDAGRKPLAQRSAISAAPNGDTERRITQGRFPRPMIDSSFGADRGWRRFSQRQDGHMSFNRKRRLSRGAAATRSAEPLCRYRIGAGYHRPLQQRRARAITRLRCWPYCYLAEQGRPSQNHYPPCDWSPGSGQIPDPAITVGHCRKGRSIMVCGEHVSPINACHKRELSVGAASGRQRTLGTGLRAGNL